MQQISTTFLKSIFPIQQQEAMRSFVANSLANQRQSPEARRGTGRRSNTTVFAIKYARGVVIAGDRRMSEGFFDIADDTVVKVKQITGFSAIACAGSCNVIEYIEKNMKTTCDTFTSLYGRDISPDGQAGYLQWILKEWWYFFRGYFYDELGVPVLAAYDESSKKPRIFSFGVDSFFYEPRIIAGTGCGFDAIKQVVIDRWHKHLGVNATIDLAVRAMIHAGKSSHGVSDAAITPPTVGVIDRKGFRWIDEKDIVRRTDRLIKTMEGIRCLR